MGKQSDHARTMGSRVKATMLHICMENENYNMKSNEKKH